MHILTAIRNLYSLCPEKRNDEQFSASGLQDLCVSRSSFTQGIPVDFDNRHVVYVWLDALTNYITGIGYDCDGGSTEQYHKYWLNGLASDWKRYHPFSYDLLAYFPDGAWKELPKQIFGHPRLLQGDGKMSKSKGNVIYADDLVDFFGVDAVAILCCMRCRLKMTV